jgi:hypothetical protein
VAGLGGIGCPAGTQRRRRAHPLLHGESERPHQSSAPRRQQVYVAALRSNPRIETTEGHFRIDKRTYPLVEPWGDKKWATVWKPEERGSDVNLGAYLLLDAFNKDFDVAAIISNDSDLTEPIKIVRRPPFGRTVLVFNPQSAEHRTWMGASRHFDLTREQLLQSQLPNPLVVGRSTFVKPDSGD